MVSEPEVLSEIHDGIAWISLALLCDMLTCADDALFAFPPARSQGSLPAVLLNLVGPQRAKRLLRTGVAIRGEESAKIGLVLKSVPPATRHSATM